MEQYEVIKQIGRGTYSTATLVRHRLENKEYVLKETEIEDDDEDEFLYEHSRLEMELLSRIRHPFIVEYKDSWVEKDGKACLILGYCDGGNMDEAVKNANGVLFSEEPDLDDVIIETKGPVRPLPTEYSDALRNLVGSMLQKDPEMRPTAGELLRDPLLQPYIHEIQVNSLKGGYPKLLLPARQVNMLEVSMVDEEEDGCKSADNRSCHITSSVKPSVLMDLWRDILSSMLNHALGDPVLLDALQVILVRMLRQVKDDLIQRDGLQLQYIFFEMLKHAIEDGCMDTLLGDSGEDSLLKLSGLMDAPLDIMPKVAVVDVEHEDGSNFSDEIGHPCLA
ncbi:unnamed protein product [Linum tenue]|uniref:Protein kinase domain-containing protein n=1 Tax=Linum tenue TaxID=586396 RepID=A0AAV0N4B4_9ROSI|nr:unnamed protein product [Linum tenue]